MIRNRHKRLLAGSAPGFSPALTVAGADSAAISAALPAGAPPREKTVRLLRIADVVSITGIDRRGAAPDRRGKQTA